MTKNKRFMIKKDGFKKYTVSDKLNQFALPITNKKSCEAIAFALNSLWEQTLRFEKSNQEYSIWQQEYLEFSDSQKIIYHELAEALKQGYKPSEEYQKMIHNKALEILGKEFNTECEK